MHDRDGGAVRRADFDGALRLQPALIADGDAKLASRNRTAKQTKAISN